MLAVQQPITPEYPSVPSGASSATMACCASPVGRACRMPHGAWSAFKVLARILSRIRVPLSTPQYPLSTPEYRYRRARCSARQQRSSVRLVRTAPECAAARDGLRRLGRRRQTRHRSSRRRSARRRHLPSSNAIHALACCTGHARPSESLPPRSRTHARTWQLSGMHQGAYRWVGSNGVKPPRTGHTRETTMPPHTPRAAVRAGTIIWLCTRPMPRIVHGRGTCTVRVVRYAHAQ